MDKKKILRIVLHLIVAIIAAIILHFLSGTDLQRAITFVVTYMIISFILDYFRDRRQAKKNASLAKKADAETVAKLMAAAGGVENIEFADHESNRVKVKIKDANLLDEEALKTMDFDSGAYFSGDQLQVTVGGHSEDFAQQIMDATRK